MSLLDRLSEESAWRRFYDYKTSLLCSKARAEALESFINAGGYLPVCERIRRGEPFPLPEKKLISKLSSQKKRVVYVYPEAENMVLKLLTYLLLRKYNHLFSRNLYSFRPGLSAKDAVRHILKTEGLHRKTIYKVDIHDYFNSVPLEQFLPLLKEVLADDLPLYRFLEGLLSEPMVLENGVPVRETKGLMAGVPTASFFANLYLRELDQWFEARGVPYARYSDDILVLADSREQAEAYAGVIRNFLADRGLRINPAKESFADPAEGFSFLGFYINGPVVDIAPATFEKLKGKMRRKTRALARWYKRNGIEGEKAAKAFIRQFNRKLIESPEGHELSWSYWFFSVINTANTLREIDHYAQECIRYLLSGTRGKARFRVDYEQMKQLGYINLVHAYYSFTALSTQRLPGCSSGRPQ